MSLLTKTQQADLRFALLSELVNAHQVAFSAEVLLRRVLRHKGLLDFEPSVAEAEAALAALHAAGYASVVNSRIAETAYFQATPAGVLAQQKGL